MPNILEVKDLAKSYGDFTAVKGNTFDIKEGEIFSLLGGNGSGDIFLAFSTANPNAAHGDEKGLAPLHSL